MSTSPNPAGAALSAVAAFALNLLCAWPLALALGWFWGDGLKPRDNSPAEQVLLALNLTQPETIFDHPVSWSVGQIALGLLSLAVLAVTLAAPWAIRSGFFPSAEEKPESAPPPA